MPRGIKINDSERTFLKNKFIEKYPHLAERVLQNSEPVFKGIVLEGNQKLSASSWRDLFHKPSYAPIDNTLDIIYKHLTNQYRAIYLRAHPDKAAEFTLPDESNSLENKIQKKGPPQYSTPISASEEDIQKLKKEKQALAAAYLWYWADNDKEERYIQDKVEEELLNHPTFMKTIKDLVDALKIGLSSPLIDEIENPLVFMGDVIEGQANSYLYGGYRFFYGKTAWVQVNGDKIEDNDALAKLCFGLYARAILNKKDEQDFIVLKDGLYLSKFLGLEDECPCKPLILIAAFQENCKDDKSVQLMACHPSYDREFDALNSDRYTMTSRAWWKETFVETKRRKSWAFETDNKTKFQIVLSNSFASVRNKPNEPNERGLSIDIDLENTQFPNAKMVLSIQLAYKKPDFDNILY